MTEVQSAQDAWKQSLLWLEQKQSTLPTVTDIIYILLAMPWNDHLQIPGAFTGATTLLFSHLLSDRWLSSDLVNMMVSYTREQVEADEQLSSKIVI
jgi:hypothetical protein